MPRGARPGDGRMRAAIAAAAALKHAQLADSLASGKRHCPRCDTWLPLAAFSPAPRASSGLHGWCRPCVAADQRQRRRAKAAATAPRPLAGWVLKCCGGRFAADPVTRWWVALHTRGCADTWQPSLSGQRASRPPRWNHARQPA